MLSRYINPITGNSTKNWTFQDIYKAIDQQDEFSPVEARFLFRLIDRKHKRNYFQIKSKELKIPFFRK